MRRFAGCVLTVIALSCSTDKMPCMQSGDAWLEMPQSRVAAIADVRTEGVCDAVKPVGGCTSGTCVERTAGEQTRIVSVLGRARGSCKVTVVFTDDCPDQSLNYRFDGPLDNCCADVCFRGEMPRYAIDACASP